MIQKNAFDRIRDFVNKRWIYGLGCRICYLWIAWIWMYDLFCWILSHFMSGNGVFWICGCGRFACLSPKMMPREQSSFIFLSRFWIFGLRLCLRIGISHFPLCLHGNGRIRIKGVADLHAWMPLVQSFIFWAVFRFVNCILSLKLFLNNDIVEKWANNQVPQSATFHCRKRPL